MCSFCGVQNFVIAFCPLNLKKQKNNIGVVTLGKQFSFIGSPKLVLLVIASYSRGP
jgi:hypothetical protein